MEKKTRKWRKKGAKTNHGNGNENEDNASSGVEIKCWKKLQERVEVGKDWEGEKNKSTEIAKINALRDKIE